MRTSLYIHIPFCVSKCDYCDFFSMPCGTQPVPENYISAVLTEVRFRAKQYGIDGWNTVYVGGGTPSLLSPEQMGRLITGILGLFPGERAQEVTVEVNPADVSEALLSALAVSGATRISCGIQAFDGQTLAAVHRRSDAASVQTALRLFSDCWRGTLSLDLIAGLPGQSCAAYRRSLEKAVSVHPAHISLYALTIEDETPLGRAVKTGAVIYDSDEADSRWITGRDFLVSHGWNQYEVSNFCLPGCECRHNMTYWRLLDYIGAGAGATGTLYGNRLPIAKNGCRWTNTRDIASYMSFWNSSRCENSAECPEEREILSRETEQFEFFMMGLRTADGICAETYLERFGTDLPPAVISQFAEWEARGRSRHYRNDGRTWYALSADGLLFLNEFLESQAF